MIGFSASFFLPAFEVAGAFMILAAFVTIGALPRIKHGGASWRVVYGTATISVAMGAIGVGLEFRLFGTPLGEWSLLLGDVGLVVGLLILLAGLMPALPKKG